MNGWWSRQEWFCVCQGDDRWVHVHYDEAPHSCARCRECSRYRSDIPEAAAIRILIGPEMAERQAAEVLLGVPPATQRKQLFTFAGYLSARLPELGQVESARIIECVEEFMAMFANPQQET